VKAQELRELSIEELGEKLDQLKKTLMQYRFQSKTGKLERQSAIRYTRRDVARVRTIMNEQKKKSEVVK
jgi:large subunit ribosomal protein L29